MKIPALIEPCPISEAVLEVRFESDFDDAPIFGIVFNQIKESFPKTQSLPILEIPTHIRNQDEKLKHLPHYRVVSKEDPNILIQIGPRVFSIIITNTYPGWGIFRNHILFGLDSLEKSGVVKRITRLGLRYINFFPENILKKSNLSLNLNGASLADSILNLKVELPDEEYINQLTVNNSVIKSVEGGVIKGSLIDIDTVLQTNLGNFFQKKEEILENCHLKEKKLFASLMSDDFVKSLNHISYV